MSWNSYIGYTSALKNNGLRFFGLCENRFSGGQVTIFDAKKGVVFNVSCDCQPELFIFAQEGSFSGGRDVHR